MLTLSRRMFSRTQMLSEVIDKGPHACGQVAIWRINSIQTELIGCELGQQLFQPSILESSLDNVVRGSCDPEAAHRHLRNSTR